MTHIYFFDIDNTLLDHRTHEIPESAIRAVDQLKKAGHTVVIATGRSLGHAQPHIDRIRPSYVIAFNGALVLKESQTVFSKPLPKERLIEIFEWARKSGYSFGANQDIQAYVSDNTPEATEPLATVKMPTQTDDPFYLYADVHQGWLFFDESLDAELLPKIRKSYPEFELVRWHKTGMDILSKEINKWTACQWVLEDAGFSAEKAIAFGDGRNDIQMISGAGLGIAMGNGHPELKAVADRIAPPLEEDGIARMLEMLAHE